ncbi:hypothetical protein TNCV_2712761 [Trichonephila clavipes]|uniref:Uncharacterized protein n=1 Tax=Trichonephila clavipes TaxID=2585209 RepID=A0A8X6R8M2_TRICX|nr:hypothetical protein TNCV_2712761 [Trichonephila clavipes]
MITRAVGSLVVRAPDFRLEGLVPGKIVEVEIGGGAIYRPVGEFLRAKTYCHLYGAQGLGQRQASMGHGREPLKKARKVTCGPIAPLDFYGKFVEKPTDFETYDASGSFEKDPQCL